MSSTHAGNVTFIYSNKNIVVSEWNRSQGLKVSIIEE